jgi:prophage regulatory protein
MSIIGDRDSLRPAPSMMMTADDLIPLSMVKAKTSLSTSTIYLWMAQGKFPLAVQVSPRCVRWVLGEIDDYNRARQAKRVVLRKHEPEPVTPPPTAPAVRRGRGRPPKAS